MNTNQISTITTDTTTGSALSALTTGVISGGSLQIDQNISFQVHDKFFRKTIIYTNHGADTLYDVRYMRSFDPD